MTIEIFFAMVSMLVLGFGIAMMLIQVGMAHVRVCAEHPKCKRLATWIRREW